MNYKILLTNQPIHNYYYLDFLSIIIVSDRRSDAINY